LLRPVRTLRHLPARPDRRADPYGLRRPGRRPRRGLLQRHRTGGRVMAGLVLELQIPFLASVLILACVAKLTVRDDGAPVPFHRQRPFVYAVALAEGAIGIALMVTPLCGVRVACVVFFASATWIIGDMTRRGKDEGCGCFGGLSAAPPGRRG